MSDARAPHPELFTAEGAGASSERPALLGGICKTCGYVFFPMQAYGCEKCGSEALEPATLKGHGKLVASAEVFIPAGPHRPAPFSVGSITTDDGAVVRAVLDVSPGMHLKPGSLMVTRLVPETRSDRGQYDLHFAPADNPEP